MAGPAPARKRSVATPRKPAVKTALSSKTPARPNGSILNFFQKAEREEDVLFVGEGTQKKAAIPVLAREDGVEDISLHTADNEQEGQLRFNESEFTHKKRRLSHGPDNDVDRNMEELFGSDGSNEKGDRIEPDKPTKKVPSKSKGPFLDDSDSDSEHEVISSKQQKLPSSSILSKPSVTAPTKTEEEEEEMLISSGKETGCPPPPLRPDDSLDMSFANLDDFADMNDYPDDAGQGGEEYRMMRFMEEQAKFEKEAGDRFDDENATMEAMVANCPICDCSLAGITSDEATRHVNACLDGNPIAVPSKAIDSPTKKDNQDCTPQPMTLDGPELGKRFARAAVPRAGQAIPFESEKDQENKTTSAFKHLMSGHAETAAWASAAASEAASRGKPAYERTCPFYKIMPDCYICVDAFRYGAVKNCNAYFLSHFHSDHYIGLTANWTHGPIYCSKVTADLVKMQLRVPARYVVPLEFEETLEVPGTEGVTVTMISANHCPGSSLFLFEKMLGKAPKMRKQRILHCGDFRACPAHVVHPLLKPDVQDAITGKTRQQKIDICYLDTTYLNPRYSFPPQEDVIRSAAELCASLSPDPNAVGDIWDKMTGKGGGGSVSKYFTPVKQTEVEPKEEVDKPIVSTKPGNAFDVISRGLPPPIARQRLLVICGTYSIGKERICKAIAQALNSKIFASPAKIRICSKLGDPELTALLTSDPLEAQVHMQMLMELRADTLRDYLDSYRPHFSRIVGFRPSGWNYRPSSGTAAGSGAGGMGAGGLGGGPAITAKADTPPSTVPTTSILHSRVWRSRFSTNDMVPQRGSARDAMCFGVPYSEHSSFRELAMFIMALRIEKVVPTVNVGSEVSRKRMKGWIDRWLAERRRGGLVEALVEGDDNHGTLDEPNKAVRLWEGKDARGGGSWW